MDNSPHTIPEFWKGYISGTNRGSLTMSLNRNGEFFQGVAIVADQEFGPSIIACSGQLTGCQASVNLLRFLGSAPQTPLYGNLKLNFGENFDSAEGTWQTDIGTQGTCKLWPTEGWRMSWWLTLAVTKFRIFLRQHGAIIYASFLIVVAILGLFQKVELSYPTLILLLVPGLYIFRRYLVELIHAFRVRKLGPIELETQNPLTEDIRRVISQHVQETVAFVVLNGFFVIRTKLLLIWLSQNPPVDRAQFNAYASTIGVPVDNLDATWSALVVSGCAQPEGERIAVTDFGRRYVAHLTRQN